MTPLAYVALITAGVAVMVHGLFALATGGSSIRVASERILVGAGAAGVGLGLGPLPDWPVLIWCGLLISSAGVVMGARRVQLSRRP